MLRRTLLTLSTLALLSSPAFAASVEKAPPPAPYQAVSKLVKLPEFLPGLGTLYVDPKTLPDGPFLAYDHQGKLVSTIYMIPLKDHRRAQEDRGAEGPRRQGRQRRYVLSTPAIPALRSRITTSCFGT